MVIGIYQRQNALGASLLPKSVILSNARDNTFPSSNDTNSEGGAVVNPNPTRALIITIIVTDL